MQSGLDGTVYGRLTRAPLLLLAAVGLHTHIATSLHSSIAIEEKAAIRQKLLSALDEPVNHVSTAMWTRAHA